MKLLSIILSAVILLAILGTIMLLVSFGSPVLFSFLICFVLAMGFFAILVVFLIITSIFISCWYTIYFILENKDKKEQIKGQNYTLDRIKASSKKLN